MVWRVCQTFFKEARPGLFFLFLDSLQVVFSSGFHDPPGAKQDVLIYGVAFGNPFGLQLLVGPLGGFRQLLQILVARIHRVRGGGGLLVGAGGANSAEMR